jgi:hypothetical protein
VLELVGIVVTMMAIAHTVMFTSLFPCKWQPLAQICGDNKQANCWADTKNMRNEKARALSKIISNIQMISPVGFNAEYIKGEDNWIADDFSRKDKEDVQRKFKGYSPSELLLLKQAKVDSQSMLLNRFHNLRVVHSYSAKIIATLTPVPTTRRTADNDANLQRRRRIPDRPCWTLCQAALPLQYPC